MMRTRERGQNTPALLRLVAVLLTPLALAGCAGCVKEASLAIGPEGGTLEATNGSGVTLIVPAGALQEPVALAVNPIAGRLPGVAGPAVEATPHGTVFKKPVSLRFALRPDDIAPGISFGELRVATLVDGRWELLPTSFPAPGIVEGRTLHFSTFAIVAPCHVSGSGSDFPLAACPTFNARIQTSTPIELDAAAASVTLVLTTRASPAGGTVNMSISGLDPSWTYYLSRDGSSQLLPLTADPSGVVTLTQQDISAEHHLLLMAQHGSVSLTSATCSTIGSWDAANRVCTLTQDILSPPLYIEENGLTLDCAGHLVGGAVHESVGVSIAQENVSVRNCSVSNVDYGIMVRGKLISLTNITATSQAVARTRSIAFDLGGSAHVEVANFTASGFDNGISVVTGSNVVLRGGSLRAWSLALLLYKTNNVTVEDLEVDGSLSGVAPINPLAPLPIGAVELNGANDTSLSRLVTSGPMTAFGSVVAVIGGGALAVQRARIDGAQVGIRLDGPEGSSVTESMFSNNQLAIALDRTSPTGSFARIYHNNFVGNILPAVTAAAAVELSDTEVSSPTYHQGNFWGRACPGPFFVAGTDSNRPDAIDSHPFAYLSAWDTANPACTPDLVPTIVTPAEGETVGIARPTFMGRTPSPFVEILEDNEVIGSGAATSGAFSVVASRNLLEGRHVVFARGSDGSGATEISELRAFRVALNDMRPPAAPTFELPINGSRLSETSVAFSGHAEPDSIVQVTSTAGAERTQATPDGKFLVSAALPNGSYTFVATATDSSGNQSPASVAVSFVVNAPSVASPISDSSGTLQISELREMLDPFVPSQGESHEVRLSGEMVRGPGAAGNHTWTLLIERNVISPSGASIIGSRVNSFPITTPIGNNNQRFVVSGSSAWDGKSAQGFVMPPGVYSSDLHVLIIRDLATPGSGGSPCGPLRLPVSGGSCKVFELPPIKISYTLLDVPPPVRGRCGGSFPAFLRSEECNGEDDNCNGAIDEGGACSISCTR